MNNECINAEAQDGIVTCAECREVLWIPEWEFDEVMSSNDKLFICRACITGTE